MNAMEAARELAAMAQTGLHFSDNPYDRDRYKRLSEIAAELLADTSDRSKEDIIHWSKSEFGYATPKVDVRAYIEEDGKVFLIKEDQDHGRWTLPGGWADVNCTPSENIIREVKEESGYDITVKSLLAVYDREKQGHEPPFPYHVYKMFFHAEIVGGTHQPNYESSECGFFSLDALPDLSTSRVLENQLIAFSKRCRKEQLTQTAFD
ncbi:MAG: NUDIX hydrolase [Cyanothece sp. SIO1E1]|nr:NUDIX hydrolase [Cyanothece sp. SIO1E1]